MQLPLLLVARCQLRVAALRGNGEHALPGPDQQRHAKSGARTQQHRAAGFGNATGGEIEDRGRAGREREGIELPVKTIEALERLAAETGVAPRLG